MSKIQDRLRGIYRIPITDGLGAVGSGEEPDNPHEFVRHYETAPIQHEAADLLDKYETMLDQVANFIINADPNFIELSHHKIENEYRYLKKAIKQLSIDLYPRVYAESDPKDDF